MTGFHISLASIALIFLGAMAPAQTVPDRFAIIFGNAAYERRADDSSVIRNSPFNLLSTANDANRYVDTLTDIGWRVVNRVITDTSRARMIEELNHAADQITEGAEVVLIFNGHGFSLNGENYLVGVPENGVLFASRDEMVSASITLTSVLSFLTRNRPSRVALIINACGDRLPARDVSTAPARKEWDANGSELLILYSSSPNGVAYDFIDTMDLEFEERPLSVFTRSFVTEIEKDQPLLSAFTNARIQVERISETAAQYRNQGVIQRADLQIPHILHDSISGAFNLTDVSATLSSDTFGQDWRVKPHVCRVNSASLNEALELRRTRNRESDPNEIVAVEACIVAAALSELGIDKLSTNSEFSAVQIAQATGKSDFEASMLIDRAVILPAGAPRESPRFESVESFRAALARHFYNPGTVINLFWRRTSGNAPSSGRAKFIFEPERQ